MRGIRCDKDRPEKIDRLTPVHAGNIKHLLCVIIPCQAHPRACGEYVASCICPLDFVGSPPRMRGIFVAFCVSRVQERLTPAYAGNIRHMISVKNGYQAHPRACGEYSAKSARFVAKSGSPPRMRGICAADPVCQRHQGFTPAYAGNTRPFCPISSPRVAHPRACGEYPGRNAAQGAAQDSPPHMREILRSGVALAILVRLTLRAGGEYYTFR